MAEMSFACPKCGQQLQVDETAVSESVLCPACSKSIVIPPTGYDDSKDESAGLLGFLEHFFRHMIWGVFRFLFVDSPRQIVRFVIRSFPWMMRLLRVTLYATAWVILTFWPILLAKYGHYLPWQGPSRLHEYVLSHERMVEYLGYTWAIVCILGSIWGLIKWASIRRGA